MTRDYLQEVTFYFNIKYIEHLIQWQDTVNYLWPIHRTEYYGAIKNNAMETQWVRKCSWVG